MLRKKLVLFSIVTILLLVSLGYPGTAASAWYGCGSSYVVQWGDTLSGIAVRCGTSVAALRQANPGIGYLIYAGQTLWMPGSSGGYMPGPAPAGSYLVQRGDTLRNIAARMGFCVSDLIAANPQLWNPNLIYPGQYINLPAYSSAYCSNYSSGSYGSPTMYTIRWGDTLRIIAARYGTTVENIMALNPQITSRSLIYAGQVIRVY